jgi:hypothetical protein
MRYFTPKVLLLKLVCPLLALGQASPGNFTSIPLKDLSTFENAGSNWSVQGGISLHPSGAVKMKTTAGEGVLVGTPGSSLTTKAKANDLRLSLQFMVSAGAEGSITLPGGHKVRISDSYKQQVPNSFTSGYLGQFPTQNAAKAPGLWQSLELAYDASIPSFTTSARLNTLSLNQVTVLEAVYLPVLKSNTEAQPIIFEVNKGTIAFKNIGYQLLATRKPITLENLKYKVYADKWDSKTYSNLSHEGQSQTLTQEVTNGMREFHLVYEGDIQAQEAGEYLFTSIYSGPVFSLDIDEKPVLTTGESSSQETHVGAVTLNQGTHHFKIHYSRFPWRRPALGLRVEKSGIRPYDLHAMSSLPEPEPKPYISVKPEIGPEMVRSFVQLEGEQYKRTHCISVGSSFGWNYTVDLNRGALVQAWRGNFANVTEMWYERGEPQLLFPAGLTVPVSGKSSIAVLQNETEAWPDSSNINFLGYKIDTKGYPGFRYAIDSATVTDQLTADNHGITRAFSMDGTPKGNVYAILATGKQIVQIEKGLYQVDDRYFIQTDKKARIVLRTAGQNQELLLPLTAPASYTMYW